MNYLYIIWIKRIICFFQGKKKYLFDIGTLILNLSVEHNIPNYLANKDLLNFFRKKISQRADLRQSLRERLRILINFSKMKN